MILKHFHWLTTNSFARNSFLFDRNCRQRTDCILNKNPPTIFNYRGSIYICQAEREGFEPPVRLPLRRISSAIHSTTLPSFLFHYDGAKVSKIIESTKFFCKYFSQFMYNIDNQHKKKHPTQYVKCFCGAAGGRTPVRT